MELELDLDKETAWTTQINSLEQDKTRTTQTDDRTGHVRLKGKGL